MQVSCNIRKCRKRGLKKFIPRSDLIYCMVSRWEQGNKADGFFLFRVKEYVTNGKYD